MKKSVKGREVAGFQTKNGFPAGVFLWIVQNFLIFFPEHYWTATSELFTDMQSTYKTKYAWQFYLMEATHARAMHG